VIIDSKYHAASLVAVFMALGMGIVIGSLLVGDSFVKDIAKEQEIIVQRLEQDYLFLRNEARFYQEEMNKLKKMNDYYQRYARETLPLVIGGCLAGKKLAVIENREAGTPGFFLDSIRLSGAEFYVAEYGSDINKGTAERYGNGAAVDALIYVNCRQAMEEREDVKKAQAGLIQEYTARGIKVYYLETRSNPGEAEAGKRADGIFYLDSSGSIPEQAALILSIAGFSFSQEANRATGF
jgi:hypothetical protein